MKKVLLLNPYAEYARGVSRGAIYPPTGLCYIASFLTQKGIEVLVVDADMLQVKREKLLNLVAAEDPEVIGISSNVVTVKAAMDLARNIKAEFPGKTLVCGGPMPSSLPSLFLETFDVVVVGEGELTMYEIVKGKKLERIEGIVFKRGKKVFRTKRRKLISNLDSLPFPAWNLLIPSLKHYRVRCRRKPVAPMITSRGCPYRCVYCNKSVFGYAYRSRTPQNLVKEIEWLLDNFGVKEIHILDDNFTLDLKRVEKFLDMVIEGRYDVSFTCQTGIRADRITERIIAKMKKAGFYRVGIGVESGDEEVLKLIGKDLKLEDVRKTVKMLKEFGIQTKSFFMLGLPGENLRKMKKTIDFALELNPLIATFAITTPFPHTKLYEYIKRHGKFLENVDEGIDAGFFGRKVFYETRTVKKEDVIRCFSFAYKKFYLRPQKLLEILFSIRSLEELKWIFYSLLTNPIF